MINSLIIFVVANGSNAIGVRYSAPEPMKTASLTSANAPGGFGLASADKSAAKPAESDKPPPKPKFFRQW